MNNIELFIEKYPDMIVNGRISIKYASDYILMTKELIKMKVYGQYMLDDFIKDLNNCSTQYHRDKLLDDLLNQV